MSKVYVIISDNHIAALCRHWYFRNFYYRHVTLSYWSCIQRKTLINKCYDNQIFIRSDDNFDNFIQQLSIHFYYPKLNYNCKGIVSCVLFHSNANILSFGIDLYFQLPIYILILWNMYVRTYIYTYVPYIYYICSF
jgi:hypothetical protein